MSDTSPLHQLATTPEAKALIDEFERIWQVYEPAEAIYMRAMEILKATEPIVMVKTTDSTASR